jgi:glycerophosphoryl diester phosphodiesterase
VESFSWRELRRDGFADLRRAFGSLLVMLVGFQLLETLLALPLLHLLLRFIMRSKGLVAVSNFDILQFLLTPIGFLYAFGLIGGYAGLMVLRQAAALVLLERANPRGSRPDDDAEQPTRPGSRSLRFADLQRAFRLGQLQLIQLLLLMVPFAILYGLVHLVFLSSQDINYFLAERPPEFLFALGLAGGLTILLAVSGVTLLARWSLALPIVLFEGLTPDAAIRASRERARGRERAIGAALVGWQLVGLGVGVILSLLFRFVTGLLPESLLENAPLMVTMVAIRGALLGFMSILVTLGHATLIRRLYVLSDPHPSSARAAVETDLRAAGRGLSILLLPLALGLPALGSGWLSAPDSRLEPPRIVAHRGYSRAAPENTLAALRAAIASGADGAEIDVQLTRDGRVVLLHDRDFKRVSGDPRRVEDMTFDEVRALDVGRRFGPDFVGERVPTLEEAVDLTRGRLRLNVELKHYGVDRGIGRTTARLLHELNLDLDCDVTSLSAESLADARRTNPRLRTGLIATVALGDITRLEGNLVSLPLERVTPALRRAAERRGLELHVWTVNDERPMRRALRQGVDAVITDDPERMLRVRAAWSELSEAERITLACRSLLGLD